MNLLIYYSIGIMAIFSLFSFLAGGNFISKANGLIEWKIFGWFWLITAFSWLMVNLRIVIFMFLRDDLEYYLGPLNFILSWSTYVLAINFIVFSLFGKIKFLKIATVI